jgi:hypothetical protein
MPGLPASGGVHPLGASSPRSHLLTRIASLARRLARFLTNQRQSAIIDPPGRMSSMARYGAAWRMQAMIVAIRRLMIVASLIGVPCQLDEAERRKSTERMNSGRVPGHLGGIGERGRGGTGRPLSLSDRSRYWLISRSMPCDDPRAPPAKAREATIRGWLGCTPPILPDVVETYQLPLPRAEVQAEGLRRRDAHVYDGVDRGRLLRVAISP